MPVKSRGGTGVQSLYEADGCRVSEGSYERTSGPYVTGTHKASMPHATTHLLQGDASTRAGLTCNYGGPDGQPGCNSKLINALQHCFEAGVHVSEEHAVDPDIAVQGGPEVPFCSDQAQPGFEGQGEQLT